MKPPSKSNFTHHDKLKKRVSQNILHALQVTSTTRKQATTPIFFRDIHLTAILFSTVNWTFWVMNLRKKVSCGHLG